MTNLKKEEQEISVEHNTSGTFATILSLDFKFQNNSRKNTENASILSALPQFT
jgi:hypothetical protein